MKMIVIKKWEKILPVKQLPLIINLMNHKKLMSKFLINLSNNNSNNNKQLIYKMKMRAKNLVLNLINYIKKIIN